MYVAVATSPASSSESSKGETIARRSVPNRLVCGLCGAMRARLNDVTEHAVAMHMKEQVESLIVILY